MAIRIDEDAKSFERNYRYPELLVTDRSTPLPPFRQHRMLGDDTECSLDDAAPKQKWDCRDFGDENDGGICSDTVDVALSRVRFRVRFVPSH